MKRSNQLSKIFIASLLVVLLGAGCTDTSIQTNTVPTTTSQAIQQNVNTGYVVPQPVQATPPAPAPAWQGPGLPAPIVFNKMLLLGSSGTVVDSLQQFLIYEGLYSGTVSGYFDQATENAVELFQQQEGITPVNGIFGSVEQEHANNIVAQHSDWLTTLSNNNQYNNVSGSPVHSPSYSSNGVPAGASALCGDGTYSFSMHRQGTCSHHGGVSEWLN